MLRTHSVWEFELDKLNCTNLPILVPKSVIALTFSQSHEGVKYFGAVLSNYRLLSDTNFSTKLFISH